MATQQTTKRANPVSTGLLSGAAAGALFGGPVGALVGAGVGLLGMGERRSELDMLAREAQVAGAAAEIATGAIARASNLARSPFDHEAVATLTDTVAMYQQALLSPDPNVRSEATVALVGFMPTLTTAVSNMEQRYTAAQDREVGVLQTLADRSGAEYQAALGGAREAQAQSESAFALLNDPGFDPNNPLSRGMLAELLGSSTRSLVIDPTDFGDVLAASGMGLPMVSQYLQMQAGKIDAADFQWTREDWMRGFQATLGAAKNSANAAFEQAAQRGIQLDQAAAEVGYQPALSYSEQILTGQVQEGQTAPGPQGMPPTPAAAGGGADAKTGVARVVEDIQGAAAGTPAEPMVELAGRVLGAGSKIGGAVAGGVVGALDSVSDAANYTWQALDAYQRKRAQRAALEARQQAGETRTGTIDRRVNR